MRDEIKNIIDAELEEKEQNLEDMYEPMQGELDKLIEEQNDKMKKLQEEHQKGIDEINKKYHNGNLTGEDLVKMQDEAMKDAMKYLNRDDN